MLFYKSPNFTVRQFAPSGFVLVIVLSLALASCGGGGAPTASPAATQLPITTQPPVATEAPVSTEPPTPTADPEIAQLCDPTNPVLATITDIKKSDISEYGNDFVSYQGSYINDKTGQKFQITSQEGKIMLRAS